MHAGGESDHCPFSARVDAEGRTLVYWSDARPQKGWTVLWHNVFWHIGASLGDEYLSEVKENNQFFSTYPAKNALIFTDYGDLRRFLERDSPHQNRIKSVGIVAEVDEDGRLWVPASSVGMEWMVEKRKET